MRHTEKSSLLLEIELIHILQEIFIEPACGACQNNSCIKKRLNTFWDSVSVGTKVVLYGIGENTRVLYALLTPENRDKITAYGDLQASLYSLYFKCYKVLAPKEVCALNPDIVFLSSKEFEQSMHMTLQQAGLISSQMMAPDFEYSTIDFSFNAFPCGNLWAAGALGATKTTKNYEPLHIALEAYLSSEYCANDELRQVALANLIFAYLSIRDIVNVHKFIKKYIERRYIKFELFEIFDIKLSDLLKRTKQCIADKATESIIIYLLDGFSEEMVADTSFIKSFYEESFCFKRAYTQYCYTTSSLQVMFTGKDLIDEGGCEIESFNIDNSPFMRMMAENGYDFEAFLIKRANLFENSCLRLTLSIAGVGSKQLWHLLNRIAVSENKAVYFVHMMETHPPYNNGFINSMMPIDSSVMGNMTNDVARFAFQSKATKYIDEQLAFYDSFVSNVQNKIMMSDHGRAYEWKMLSLFPKQCNFHALATQNCNIFLSVKSPYIDEGDSYGIFPLTGFYKLLSVVMGKRKDLVFEPSAKIQALPTYAEEALKLQFPNLALPIRGIITSDGVYLRNYNGDEWYFPEMSNVNVVNDPNYADKIEQARKLCGTDFHDIFNRPKFAMAKKYYCEAGLINEDGSAKQNGGG